MRHAVQTMHTVLIAALTVALLAACGSSPTTLPQPTAQPSAAVAPATHPQPSATLHKPPATEPGEDPVAFPLSEPGLFDVGIRRNLAFEDASRGGREVSVTVWYPAETPQGSSTAGPTPDAVADPSSAPYPLVLSSSKVGFIFAPHLASYGFVVVGIDGIDTYLPWDQNLLDQPLDILFALDQVAKNPIEGLEGMIDSEHVGTMGYSFDGYNALAVSGARVVPEFYLAECAKTPLKDHWIKFGYCNVAGAWDQFAAYAGEAVTTTVDGLWQPMTDQRIRAVMPMAPEGAALFGDRGLSAADRAILIIGATEDHDCEYSEEAVHIFEQVGTPDKSLISFVGQDHYMVFEPLMVSRMAHFTVAFFGHQLQGRQELATYYSEGFVAKQEGLAWGPYTTE